MVSTGTLTNWGIARIVADVRYLGQRMRFAPFVRNEILGTGVETAKFLVTPVGGPPSAASTGLDLPAPSTNMDLPVIDISPNTPYQSDTVDLQNYQMARIAGGADFDTFGRDVLDKLGGYLDGWIYEQMRARPGGYAQVNVLSANPDGAFASATDNLKALRNLNRAFNRMDVDIGATDISVVLSDDGFRDILGYPNIIQAQVRGDAEAGRRAMVGPVLGFTRVIGSGRVSGINFGNAAGQHLVNNAGGYPLGYGGSIDEDAGTGSFAAGDIVYFGTNHDTADVYVIQSVSGRSFRLTRPLSAAVADNAQIHKVGTTQGAVQAANLAFAAGAFAFVTRDLEASSTPDLVQVVGRDPATGLSLRLIIEKHAKGYRLGYDLMFGGAVLQPRYIAILGSNS